jgi:hypothetical protein
MLYFFIVNLVMIRLLMLHRIVTYERAFLKNAVYNLREVKNTHCELRKTTNIEKNKKFRVKRNRPRGKMEHRFSLLRLNSIY